MSIQFAEIEIGDGKDKPVPLSQLITAPDPVRQAFFDMRSLAGDNPYTWNDSSLFYRQAKYMAAFTDSWKGNQEFSMHYPCYQRMSYERLRTYFTWRTRARTGDYARIGASYLFLYIYELLLCIHSDPRGSLDELMHLRREYTPAFPFLADYLTPWLRDFHIYYGLDFPAFVRESGMREAYRDQFLFDADAADLPEIWASLSGVDFSKSKLFDNGKNEKIFRECFAAAVRAISPEILMHIDSRPTRWFPFRRALFHPWLRGKDTQIAWPNGEVFTHKNGEWYTRAVTPLAKRGRVALTVIRTAEHTLGGLLGISTRPPNSPMKEIAAAVTEAYRAATRIEVKVSSTNLARIREEAEDITEKLVVEEYENQTPDAQAAPPPTPEEGPSLPITEEERLFLAALLTQGDISGFPFPEIIIDSINAKSYDFLGDALIDTSCPIPQIYPEYMHHVQ